MMLGHASERLLCGKKGRAIWFGQVLSLLIALTGVFSEELARREFSVPATQNAMNYALLSLYLVYEWRRPCGKETTAGGGSGPGSRTPLWQYAVLAVLDVEANFLVVLAYRWTSFTSVMLLDCFTIPSSMVLSYWFLNARYNRIHVVGVLICLLGLGLTVLSDLVVDGHDPRFPDAWKGDLCCLVAAVLYAASNVTEEFLVKKHGTPCRMLGYLGVFGVLLSVIQAGALEGRRWGSLPWTPLVGLFFTGFAVAMFTLYTLVAFFLGIADSALFNLSLLTSDVYAVVFTVFVAHGPVTLLYFVALGTTGFGLFVYHSQPAPAPQERVAQAPLFRRPAEAIPLRLSRFEALTGNPILISSDSDEMETRPEAVVVDSHERDKLAGEA